MSDLSLKRKITVKAHGQQIVLIKKPVESIEHVWTKAFLWARYLPSYPALLVEVPVNNRYKPDLVALNDNASPVLWAEAGKVRANKIRHLARRYRDCHLVIAKWTLEIEPYKTMYTRALKNLSRTAPVELIGINNKTLPDMVGPDGELNLQAVEHTLQTLP